MVEALPNPAAVLHYLDAAEAAIGRPVTRPQLEGPESALADVLVGSALVYLCDWAWGTELLRAGIEPVALAGYGVGELAALAVARAVSPGAGLQLAIVRSRAIAQVAADTDGATVAVIGLSVEQVTDVLRGVTAAWVSAIDGPLTIRIAGSLTVIAALEPALRAAGALRVSALTGQGAVGTPYLNDASARFASLLDQVEVRPPHYPVVSPVTGVATTDIATIKSSLVTSLSETTRWTEVLGTLAALGAGALVECGPGGGLSSLAAHAGYQALAPSAIGVEHTVSSLRSMV